MTENNMPPLPVQDGVLFAHVREFSDGYAASSDGRIWTCRTPGYGKAFYPRWKELRCFKNNRGYLDAVFRQHKGPRVYRNVHRVIALLFLEPKEGREFVNHIDGNKLNNCKSNLEFVTHRENIQHAAKLGLLGRHDYRVRQMPATEAAK